MAPALAAKLDIEDDMDDFDDILEQFKPISSTPSQPEVQNLMTTSPNPITTNPSPPENKSKLDTSSDSDSEHLPDDFARDLAEGMEALLSSLKEEDGGEFKKHLEAMIASEVDSNSLDLLQALGNAGNDSNTKKTTSFDKPGPSTSVNDPQPPQSFQDAIRSTMEKLKESDSSAKNNHITEPASDEELAALFEQMMSAEGGLPDESQLQTMLQGFMEELMSKEVMYEPLKEMNQQFPGWLDENRNKLSKEDLDRYQTQSEIVSKVVKKFEDPAWDVEEKAGGDDFLKRQEEVVILLTKMQDCGPPPQEIMGEMPTGMMGENGLPNPEQCLIS
ncbi:hypothetical protein CROQUDRAFT_42285 [Cronartium quercuum f. sp. fusiforme G11]|uniref:Uncharacterized protein n=1 Tax=Cronartium quercuum f. sp. fusiforme G11 TaxID=708437 RepID=A0A9P6NPK1_9BASI|nr:hypothetical protein CROQUDRAFT_42285 [Cronartium quercuum f. sp. fusiforme G11]